MSEPFPPSPLEAIYRVVPPVPCIAGCMACCVSPTITLAEFRRLFGGIIRELPQAEVEAFVSAPMRPHPDFEGNFHCRLQRPNGWCGCHPDRALACRLHGLPVIEEMHVSNLENCTIMEKSCLPQVPVEEARIWLDRLIAHNRDLLADYGENFHRLIGLNLECWLDLYFLEDLSGFAASLQEALRSGLAYPYDRSGYRPHTEIRERLELITLLEILIETGDGDAVLTLVKELRHGHPSTGTYFREESAWLEEKLAGREKT